jgi:hypothetical protein
MLSVLLAGRVVYGPVIEVSEGGRSKALIWLRVRDNVGRYVVVRATAFGSDLMREVRRLQRGDHVALQGAASVPAGAAETDHEEMDERRPDLEVRVARLLSPNDSQAAGDGLQEGA